MKRSAEAYLTISVDDGHPSDFRSAELLSRYGLKATFYIPRDNPEREVMSERSIRSLASQFEIGGHTLSHLPLTKMSPEKACSEIVEGKAWLEDVLSQNVDSFCYPRGKINRAVVQIARESGFKGARTCMQNHVAIPTDPFLVGVSTQAYSHSPLIQLRHALIEGNFTGALNFLTVHKANRDWEAHFKKAVKYVASRCGVAHLYFHSWEIDEQAQWEKLERILHWLSTQKELTSITNGELFGKCQKASHNFSRG